jgi:hypothetical protein
LSFLHYSVQHHWRGFVMLLLLLQTSLKLCLNCILSLAEGATFSSVIWCFLLLCNILACILLCIKRFCKREICHCHYAISVYYSCELLITNMLHEHKSQMTKQFFLSECTVSVLWVLINILVQEYEV